MRYEKETGMEDWHTLVNAWFKAAERMHSNWQAQQKRMRRPRQSPSQSRSQVDQSRPQMARIRYERTLADILFVTDYDENNLLARNINLFSPHDSDNDMIQKLLQLQELCVTCGQTPADELTQ